MTSEIKVLPSQTDISAELDSLVSRLSKEAIARSGKFTVAISGGSLPKTLAANLKSNTSIDWTKWHVFLADERCVAADHPDSNMLLIQNELLQHTSVPASQVYPMAPEFVNDPAKAASHYHDTLNRVFATDGVPSFDLILLGIGPDGHTCSLFPDHALLEESRVWVAHILDSPKPPPSRITLTYPVLNAARNVVFVTTGGSKADVLKEILEMESGLPAARVKPQSKVLWLLDAPAASKLKK